MNTVSLLHPPVIHWNGISFDQTPSGIYIPVASTRGHVADLIGTQNSPDNVIQITPKGKSMVAYSDTANMPGEIDYLSASRGYHPVDLPESAFRVDFEEIDSPLYKIYQICISLLKGGGGDNHKKYQLAKQEGYRLRKSNRDYFNGKIFATNWCIADGYLYNAGKDVSDSMHQESDRISIILATKLAIPVQLTHDQDILVKSITPVYRKVKKLKKAA